MGECAACRRKGWANLWRNGTVSWVKSLTSDPGPRQRQAPNHRHIKLFHRTKSNSVRNIMFLSWISSTASISWHFSSGYVLFQVQQFWFLSINCSVDCKRVTVNPVQSLSMYNFVLLRFDKQLCMSNLRHALTVLQMLTIREMHQRWKEECRKKEKVKVKMRKRRKEHKDRRRRTVGGKGRTL